MIFSLLLFFPVNIDSTILNGMDAAYEEHFNKAESLFLYVKKSMKAHPVGYFLLASLYELEYIDEGIEEKKEKFYAYADSGERIGERYIKENPEDALGYFFTGGIYTIQVFYFGLNGDYLKALMKALPALDDLSKCIKKDTTIYDAYLGLGGYNYFKGLFPFVRGAKEEGLRQISLAIDKGRYTRNLASIGLANLYIREKKYEQARLILRDLLKRYPDSRTISWPIFTSFFEEGKMDSALFYVDRLLELSNTNEYCFLQASYFKAKILLNEKRYREALEFLSQIKTEGSFMDWRKKLIALRKDAEKCLQKETK